ncbi:MAG: peptide chain release factor N(5)-glutamine methyltransferase [Actinobacteria bacterium]|nr:peptide chain release factor N(5)-glutamine methyltransferase [Actinomycetota bacterium]
MDLPAHEASRLIAVVTGRPPHAARKEDLTSRQSAALAALVARRLAGEPLQYLEGSAAFGPLEVAVDRRALIPRPETEGLWELAVAALGDAGPGTTIVDLGTGSGVLALALKHAFPAARVIGTDDRDDALALAAENAARLGLDVEFRCGDLFDALPGTLLGRLDLVVSNPPYVAEHEWDGLPVEVRGYEPRHALVAGPTGTEVLERIADDGYWWLGVGGYLLCEIGENQGPSMELAYGAFDRHIRRDLTGRDRYVVARKGSPCCV